MATLPPQRAYRAACPNCGAPVEFASAASSSAVCSFCRSTLVRDGEALRRIGVSAELFDDHSPLQLGVGGRLGGVAFTLIGRLQYGHADGTWNEWHALFDNGRSGWLSEDNGAYVFVFDAAAPPEAPPASTLVAGMGLRLAGREWDVASVVRTKLIAAEGELPQPPRLDREFVVADLRNTQGEVGTLDYGDAPTLHFSVGRSVALSSLALTGLRDANEKTLGSRGFNCPNCGNALELKLSTTKSITCPQCNAVVDVSNGIGGDLAHYAQNNAGVGGLEPQIALGSMGTLAIGTGTAVPWQVVGYMERCDLPAAGDDDEQTFWREYLLYNRTEGFCFLVDAEDGWSLVAPITGAPKVQGDTANHRGDTYKRRYAYDAKVTWVQGEFYWRVRREDRAHVADYDGTGKATKKLLSREQSGNEVTWSAGEKLDAKVVADAFSIPADQRAALQRDVAPTSGMPGSSGLSKGMMLFIAIIVVVILVSMCTSGGDDCRDTRATFGESSAEYQQCMRSRGSGGRTSGGSFGGWSSGGGGHK